VKASSEDRTFGGLFVPNTGPLVGAAPNVCLISLRLAPSWMSKTSLIFTVRSAKPAYSA
jgi:hypothetical protein